MLRPIPLLPYRRCGLGQKRLIQPARRAGVDDRARIVDTLPAPPHGALSARWLAVESCSNRTFYDFGLQRHALRRGPGSRRRSGTQDALTHRSASHPARLGDSRIHSVDVAVPDRRRRTPELIVVLRLKDADLGVDSIACAIAASRRALWVTVAARRQRHQLRPTPSEFVTPATVSPGAGGLGLGGACATAPAPAKYRLWSTRAAQALLADAERRGRAELAKHASRGLRCGAGCVAAGIAVEPRGRRQTIAERRPAASSRHRHCAARAAQREPPAHHRRGPSVFAAIRAGQTRAAWYVDINVRLLGKTSVERERIAVPPTAMTAFDGCGWMAAHRAARRPPSRVAAAAVWRRPWRRSARIAMTRTTAA